MTQEDLGTILSRLVNKQQRGETVTPEDVQLLEEGWKNTIELLVNMGISVEEIIAFKAKLDVVNEETAILLIRFLKVLPLLSDQHAMNLIRGQITTGIEPGKALEHFLSYADFLPD